MLLCCSVQDLKQNKSVYHLSLVEYLIGNTGVESTLAVCQCLLRANVPCASDTTFTLYYRKQTDCFVLFFVLHSSYDVCSRVPRGAQLAVVRAARPERVLCELAKRRSRRRAHPRACLRSPTLPYTAQCSLLLRIRLLSTQVCF